VTTGYAVRPFWTILSALTERRNPFGRFGYIKDHHNV
jgi:hypothetical protein